MEFLHSYLLAVYCRRARLKNNAEMKGSNFVAKISKHEEVNNVSLMSGLGFVVEI